MAQLEFTFPTRPRYWPPWLVRSGGYAGACLGVLAALLLRLWLEQHWGHEGPFITFFFTIVLVAWFTPVGPSILATVVSVLLGDYFFVGDPHQLSLNEPGVLLSDAFFLAASALVIAAMERGRRVTNRERATLTALQERVAELDASEEFNRRIVASTADSLQVLDLAGNLLAVSPSGRKLLEIEDPESLRGTSWASLWPEKCRPKIERAIQAAREGTPGCFAGTFRTPQGTERYWDVVITPMCNRGGRPERLLAVARDITEARNAQEQVRRNEHEFRAMFELSVVGKAQVDPVSGRFSRVNRALCDLMGYPAEELLQKTDSELIHPEDREANSRAIRHALGGELDRWVTEARYLKRDGKVISVNVGTTLLRDQDGQPWRLVRTIQDVTQRRLAEEALLKAKEDLAQANADLEVKVRERTHSLQETTEQLNAFCYSVAHDLRAPLRTQMGFARIILDDYGSQMDDAGRRYLRLMIQAGERQGRLMEDLLTHISVSRADLPMEPTALRHVLRQACADLAADLEQTHAKIDIQVEDCQLLANASSLHLVMLNLLSNALKYSRKEEKPRIIVRTQRLHRTIRVCVEDNGVGIAEEHLGKLFRLFQRLPGSQDIEGTGMGLAIVKKAVERMGGGVGVESEVGKGSIFWVELQSTDPPVAAAKMTARREKQTALSGINSN